MSNGLGQDPDPDLMRLRQHEIDLESGPNAELSAAKAQRMALDGPTPAPEEPKPKFRLCETDAEKFVLPFGGYLRAPFETRLKRAKEFIGPFSPSPFLDTKQNEVLKQLHALKQLYLQGAKDAYRLSQLFDALDAFWAMTLGETREERTNGKDFFCERYLSDIATPRQHFDPVTSAAYMCTLADIMDSIGAALGSKVSWSYRFMADQAMLADLIGVSNLSSNPPVRAADVDVLAVQRLVKHIVLPFRSCQWTEGFRAELNLTIDPNRLTEVEVVELLKPGVKPEWSWLPALRGRPGLQEVAEKAAAKRYADTLQGPTQLPRELLWLIQGYDARELGTDVGAPR